MGRGAPSARSRAKATANEARKHQRACDYCRRRKTKCERPPNLLPHDDRCNNCKIAHIPCTFKEDAKPRGFTERHVSYLQERERRIADILRKLDPSIDLIREVGPPISRDDRPDRSTTSSNPDAARGPAFPPWPHHSQLPDDHPRQWRDRPHDDVYDDDDDQSSSSSDSDDDEYCGGRPPRLGTFDEDDSWNIAVPRFHGKSSFFSMVAQMKDMKLSTKANSPASDQMQDPDNTAHQSSDTNLETKLGYKSKMEDAPQAQFEIVFPPHDLLMVLVDVYLNQVNVVYPLLHGPTFVKDIASHRHMIDPGFACILLMVCAVASRYSTDPRVLAKTVTARERGSERSPQSPLRDDESSEWIDDLGRGDLPGWDDAPWSSAGWKFFNRAYRFMHDDAYPVVPMDAIKLHELQTAFLIYQFHLGRLGKYSSLGLLHVNVAIRRAQDLGAHRQKRYAERGLEGELWRRACWCLLLAARDAGLYGPSGAARIEDFDLNLPLEVDDEYWATDDKGLNPVFLEQPAGKPSVVAAFNAQLRLSDICDMATSYLYPLEDDGSSKNVEIVSGLEKAMKQWLAALPPHLESASARRDPVWNVQSAILYTKYHLLRIHMYRNFIGAKEQPPLPTSAPASSSAKNAANNNALSTCVVSALGIATTLRNVMMSSTMTTTTTTASDPSATGSRAAFRVQDFVTGAGFAGRVLRGVIAANGRRGGSSKVMPPLEAAEFVGLPHLPGPAAAYGSGGAASSFGIGNNAVGDLAVAVGVCEDFLREAARARYGYVSAMSGGTVVPLQFRPLHQRQQGYNSDAVHNNASIPPPEDYQQEQPHGSSSAAATYYSPYDSPTQEHTTTPPTVSQHSSPSDTTGSSFSPDSSVGYHLHQQHGVYALSDSHSSLGTADDMAPPPLPASGGSDDGFGSWAKSAEGLGGFVSFDEQQRQDAHHHQQYYSSNPVSNNIGSNSKNNDHLLAVSELHHDHDHGGHHRWQYVLDWTHASGEEKDEGGGGDGRHGSLLASDYSAPSKRSSSFSSSSEPEQVQQQQQQGYHHHVAAHVAADRYAAVQEVAHPVHPAVATETYYDHHRETVNEQRDHLNMYPDLGRYSLSVPVASHSGGGPMYHRNHLQQQQQQQQRERPQQQQKQPLTLPPSSSSAATTSSSSAHLAAALAAFQSQTSATPAYSLSRPGAPAAAAGSGTLYSRRHI